MSTATDEKVKPEQLAGLSLDTLREKRDEVVARCEELAVAQQSEPKRERHVELKARMEDVKTYATVIAEREGDADTLAEIKKMREAEEARKAQLRSQRPPIYEGDTPPGGDDFKTPGERFVESDVYKEFKGRGCQGASDVMPFPEASKLMGLRTGTDKLKMRALISGADATAGTLTRPQFLGLQEPGLVRPLVLRDLVTVLPTESEAIEYVREDVRTSNARVVPEADQLAHVGDETATKPEGGLTFTPVIDTVRLIGEWVAVTTKILQDAPQLRGYIDEYLLFDLQLELEDQMIAGTGGDDFVGILNTPGIQTIAAPGAGTTALDNLRKAITLIQVNALAQPSAIALSPADSQNIDLLKKNNEVNNFVGSGPFGYQANQPIWGLPRIVIPGLPTGRALVGDFRRAVLYDRSQAQILVGTVGDDFIRNIRRILAEGRWGFGVRRPKAFVDVTL
jgi:HK97 family phage major capsid protein